MTETLVLIMIVRTTYSNKRLLLEKTSQVKVYTNKNIFAKDMKAVREKPGTLNLGL